MVLTKVALPLLRASLLTINKIVLQKICEFDLWKDTAF